MQLIELESQLKLEIKARNRAEKMLKFAKKKLESLNISATLGQSSSPASGGSGGSSSCSSSLQEPDERSSPQKEEIGKCNTGEKIKKVANSSPLEDFRCENSAATAAHAVDQGPCYEQSSGSVDTANSHNNEDGSDEDANEFKDSLRARESTNDAFRYVYAT